MTLLHKVTLTAVTVLLSFSTAAFAAGSASYIYNDKGAPISQITTLAGNGEYGEQEGAAATASFRGPLGLTLGTNGDLFISDTGNHRIQQLRSNQINTFAGPSSSIIRDTSGQPLGAYLDGTGNSLFNAPVGLAYGSDGNLYVADSGSNAIRKITPSGKVVTLAGNGKLGSADGKGGAASFYQPMGIAVTESGVVYVADTLNHLIRKINPDGTTVTLNAPSGRIVEHYPGLVIPSGNYKDGRLDTALFNEPTGLALDAKGNLYVSDSGNQRIRYIDFAANLVTTLAGGNPTDALTVYGKNAIYAAGGYKDGAAKDAAFNFPKGIALDASGGLWIADSLNHTIRYLNNGMVTTAAGSPSRQSGYKDGIEGTALFNLPYSIAVSSTGALYVADADNSVIRKIIPYKLPAGITAAQTKISVVLNDKQIGLDVSPEIQNGRVMVPVRQIAEALGYTLSFANNGKTIILEKNKSRIELYLGSVTSIQILPDGRQIPGSLDAVPYVKNNRTFVPLRFFAEEAGMDVQWLKTFKTAILRFK
ncbi:stalk domain-containing protein [Paenibacillus camerounensis]|uniref:stalk domain-containing protein n=1 Tax=Paenibacillus camerounensis TaxID=1243663 RepID=UPI0005A81226|nr:stalk domain-containing protein [Paenibacillus camerounensis]